MALVGGVPGSPSDAGVHSPVSAVSDWRKKLPHCHSV